MSSTSRATHPGEIPTASPFGNDILNPASLHRNQLFSDALSVARTTTHATPLKSYHPSAPSHRTRNSSDLAASAEQTNLLIGHKRKPGLSVRDGPTSGTEGSGGGFDASFDSQMTDRENSDAFISSRTTTSEKRKAQNRAWVIARFSRSGLY